MTRTIYFHIDEIARDSIVAAHLRKALQPYGVEVDYGGRLKSYQLREAHPYDALVFPSVDLMRAYFSSPEEIIEPVIVLPTEGVGGICYNPERLALHLLGSDFVRGDRRWAERVDVHALWSRLHLDNIRIYAPQLERCCRLVGHPRHDRGCLAPPPVADGNERIKIGLVTRFDPINPYDARSMIRTVYEGRRRYNYEFSSHDQGLDIEDLLYVTTMDLRVMFDIVDRLDPATHEAIIRVHPREDRNRWVQLLSTYKINARLAPLEEPFIPWLHSIDYLIAPPSTTFYDCFAIGKPGICTMNLVPERARHMLHYGEERAKLLQHIPSPSSIDELLGLVTNRHPPHSMAVDGPVAEAMAYEAGYPDSGNSIATLAQLCLDIMAAAPLANAPPSPRFALPRLTDRPDPDEANPNEQSANFTLTKSRRRWIDALAGL